MAGRTLAVQIVKELLRSSSSLPMGSDHMITSILQCLVQFQFRFAMGGATCRRLIYRLPLDISIHAPRRGATGTPPVCCLFSAIFQSTLPVGGATCEIIPRSNDFFISIHAPRVESDSKDAQKIYASLKKVYKYQSLKRDFCPNVRDYEADFCVSSP